MKAFNAILLLFAILITSLASWAEPDITEAEAMKFVVSCVIISDIMEAEEQYLWWDNILVQDLGKDETDALIAAMRPLIEYNLNRMPDSQVNLAEEFCRRVYEEESQG